MNKATTEATAKKIQILRQFIGTNQLYTILRGTKGEESSYFVDKIAELYDTITTMPKTYEQDGMGDDAVAYLHYFIGNYDCYITEKDMESEQFQAFGWVTIGNTSDLGYVNIEEITNNNVELDLHWTPKTLREIKAS